MSPRLCVFEGLQRRLTRNHEMRPPAADWRLAILPRAPAAEAANAEGSPQPAGPGSRNRATQRRFIRRHAAPWREAARFQLAAPRPSPFKENGMHPAPIEFARIDVTVSPFDFPR